MALRLFCWSAMDQAASAKSRAESNAKHASSKQSRTVSRACGFWPTTAIAEASHGAGAASWPSTTGGAKEGRESGVGCMKACERNKKREERRTGAEKFKAERSGDAV